MKHRESKHVQTDQMNRETLRIFENLIKRPHSVAFCKISVNLTNAYGKLDVDNEVLFVKFIVQEKINFFLILLIFSFL